MKRPPRPQLSDRAALDQIATILRDNEWNADTYNDVAECVRLTGRTAYFSAED